MEDTVMSIQHEVDTIIDYLLHYSLKCPHKTAFIILENGREIEKRISYQELLFKVKALAYQLTHQQLAGKLVLVMYQEASEFLISFLACQYVGAIPVPVSDVKGSRQFARLMNIMKDAQVTAVLCATHTVTHLRKELHGFPDAHNILLFATDIIPASDKGLEMPRPAESKISFIQYTSGSTDKPKGVIITNKNLLHNQRLIKNTFGCDPHSIIFSWLPFHHDMGLIGNLLHTIYAGCTCVLMSPLQFLQTPGKWLEAISRYRITHSGGPNFAYDLCLRKVTVQELERMDLSAWRVAFNGSEPVNDDTIERFSNYFKPAGFKEEAFYPCYGLAEATLLVAACKKEVPPVTIFISDNVGNNEKITVTAHPSPGTRALVSCGAIAEGMELKIISAQDRRVCGELEEGEICISGNSVTSGYWNRDASEVFHEYDNRLFLRTGDLGFMYQGELFVHGRLKEMLIVRGQNIYPYDIERMISGMDVNIEENGVAIFSRDLFNEDIIIVAEIRRTSLKSIDAAHLMGLIERAVTGSFGITPYDILFTTPMGIPRTTSGKLQRLKCRQYYQDNTWEVIASKRGLSKLWPRQERDPHLLDLIINDQHHHNIRVYLVDLIRWKTGASQTDVLSEGAALTSLGVDSLGATELINIINNELHINLDVTKVFQDNTILTFTQTIAQLLWLKNEHISGEEITI